MKKCFFLACALLALGVGRVAAQGPTYGFARDADFSKYKTYKWVSIESAQYLDELTADQVLGTLETELAKKGLTQSKSDKADLYIGYQIAGGSVKQLNHYDIGSQYEPPAAATAETAGDAAITVHSGPLVLYMYDAAKKQLVWWSVLPNAIDANADPDKKQKHLDKAIAKLLKDYPPQKKS
ncbi:MAG TPA: DUF4136 domain-containing protein [Candidatus Acidoferrum sp.]|nr:DUF4136 domain-containing protein [Candidatus Acidoferrum sp.]